MSDLDMDDRQFSNKPKDMILVSRPWVQLKKNRNTTINNIFMKNKILKLSCRNKLKDL